MVRNGKLVFVSGNIRYRYGSNMREIDIAADHYSLVILFLYPLNSYLPIALFLVKLHSLQTQPLQPQNSYLKQSQIFVPEKGYTTNGCHIYSLVTGFYLHCVQGKIRKIIGSRAVNPNCKNKGSREMLFKRKKEKKKRRRIKFGEKILKVSPIKLVAAILKAFPTAIMKCHYYSYLLGLGSWIKEDERKHSCRRGGRRVEEK